MSTSRMIVFRSLRATRDTVRRRELVLEFTRGEISFLLRQLEDPADDLSPESIAKALRDVASVLLLPPAGETPVPPAADPSDALGGFAPAPPAGDASPAPVPQQLSFDGKRVHPDVCGCTHASAWECSARGSLARCPCRHHDSPPALGY